MYKYIYMYIYMPRYLLLKKKLKNDKYYYVFLILELDYVMDGRAFVVAKVASQHNLDNFYTARMIKWEKL